MNPLIDITQVVAQPFPPTHIREDPENQVNFYKLGRSQTEGTQAAKRVVRTTREERKMTARKWRLKKRPNPQEVRCDSIRPTPESQKDAQASMNSSARLGPCLAIAWLFPSPPYSISEMSEIISSLDEDVFSMIASLGNVPFQKAPIVKSYFLNMLNQSDNSTALTDEEKNSTFERLFNPEARDTTTRPAKALSTRSDEPIGQGNNSEEDHRGHSYAVTDNEEAKEEPKRSCDELDLEDRNYLEPTSKRARKGSAPTASDSDEENWSCELIPTVGDHDNPIVID